MFDVCIVGKALSPYRQTFNEVSQEMKGKASLVVVDCGWVVMGVTSLGLESQWSFMYNAYENRNISIE